MKAHEQFSNYVILSFETDLKCLNGNVRDMELPIKEITAVRITYFSRWTYTGKKVIMWFECGIPEWSMYSL